MPRFTDTIAALATPAGTAALAVLRVSGPDTLALATGIVGAPPLPRLARHTDYRNRAGQLIDDVVATYFQGPRSYTGEDSLELSCHGNPFIAQSILEDLFSRGCRPAEPGEFTQRAFLNGRMDLSQAEAVMDLIHARSERALEAANQQLRGAVGRRVNALVDKLLGVLARIEAYIDFPDEDLPPEDQQFVGQQIRTLQSDTQRLLATSHYGALLRDGIKTVIVGEPNVGKSSLLNRLIGRDRALVSPEPGTTRDFIEERIVVGTHWLRLIDTAGLNPIPAPLEKLGMEKTRERLAEADLVLVVLDITRRGEATNEELTSYLEDSRSLIVFNKSDLRLNSHGLDRSPSLAGTEVSALTGEGIEQLVGEITRRADAFHQQVGPELVAVNARHARSLRDAGDGLTKALQMMGDNDPIELVASELRGVLAAYGDIAGKVDNERMLDQLFHCFCIGK